MPPNVLYVRLSKRLASLQIPVFALTRVSVPLISDTADRPDQLLPRLPSCRKRGLHRRAQCIVDARLVTRPLAPIERQHVLVQTDRHDFLDGPVELAPHRAREPFIGQFGNVGEVDVFILDFGNLCRLKTRYAFWKSRQMIQIDLKGLGQLFQRGYPSPFMSGLYSGDHRPGNVRRLR